MAQEEGNYTLKRVDKLPTRGNANLLYTYKIEKIESLFRWLPEGKYEEIQVGGSGNISIQSGTNVTVSGDGSESDPFIISSSTNTSDLANDGADGITPFAVTTDIYQPTQIIEVDYYWLSDYTYKVVRVKWIEDGVVNDVTFNQDIVLGASDPTNDRIDSVVLNLSTDSLGSVPGTPAPQPSPELLTEDQLLLFFVLVNANTTEPSGVSNKVLYDENLQEVGGETDTSTNAPTKVDFDNTADPYRNTKAIEFDLIDSGEYIELSFAATDNISNYDKLLLRIKCINTVNHRLRLNLRNSGGGLVSNNVNITNGVFGFDSSNTTDYQDIVIPVTHFDTSLLATFNRIRIQNRRNNASYYIDAVEFQEGSGNIPSNIPERTSQLINDGETGNSKYIEGSLVSKTTNIDAVNLSGSGTEIEQVRDYINNLGLTRLQKDIDNWFKLNKGYTFKNSDNINDIGGQVAGIHLGDSGTKFYLSRHNNVLVQYTLTTPYNVSTAVEDYTTTIMQDGNALQLNSTGTKAIHSISGNTQLVSSYDLGTPWDVRTATLNSSLDVGVDINGKDSIITDDGLNLFTLVGNDIRRYELTVPWDMTTASLHSSNSSFGSAVSLAITEDMSTLILVKTSSIHRVTLTTPGDLTTLVESVYSIPMSELNIAGNPRITIAENGLNFVIGQFIAANNPDVKGFSFTEPYLIGEVIDEITESISTEEEYYRLIDRGEGALNDVTTNQLEKVGKSEIVSKNISQFNNDSNFSKRNISQTRNWRTAFSNIDNYYRSRNDAWAYSGDNTSIWTDTTATTWATIAGLHRIGSMPFIFTPWDAKATKIKIRIGQKTGAADDLKVIAFAIDPALGTSSGEILLNESTNALTAFNNDTITITPSTTTIPEGYMICFMFGVTTNAVTEINMSIQIDLEEV